MERIPIAFIHGKTNVSRNDYYLPPKSCVDRMELPKKENKFWVLINC